MKFPCRILIVLLALGTVAHGQITYYIEGLHRQGDAAKARTYLGIQGSNIFNWGTNCPCGTNAPVVGPYVLKAGDTMTGPLTNKIVGDSYIDNLWVTNLTVGGNGGLAPGMLSFNAPTPSATVGGHLLVLEHITPFISQVVPVSIAGADQFGNLQAADITNYGSFNSSGTISMGFPFGVNNGGYDGTQWYGDGAGLTNVPTVGLTVTQTLLLVSGGTTNLYTNSFANGLLVASGPVTAGHLSSIILPGGGYLLQPSGGTILLP